ncbi:PREDICTED: homeobox protein Hox-B7-like [Thamnophis sirtalis]|uniref:Homeobox protein Hox-B7-like n=1 Tax=Thamnophis sirtalis TaxID=35019 RepID=A0A6I9Z1M7_9SAUR|nr:PREDICTED: homeobox protein Hox-B7-like [Thamnophis sirtalis]
MSSLYYANALFSKYQAANSVFPSGVFPEQTSCAFASNAQRTGYGSSSTASFAASMPGLYPSGGGMHPQPPGMYSSGYGLDTSSFNMHCSPFEQNLSMMCPGDVSKPNCNKSDQRDTDLRHESNLRIYPWMRSTVFEECGGILWQHKFQNILYLCLVTLEKDRDFLNESKTNIPVVLSKYK